MKNQKSKQQFKTLLEAGYTYFFGLGNRTHILLSPKTHKSQVWKAGKQVSGQCLRYKNCVIHYVGEYNPIVSGKKLKNKNVENVIRATVSI